MLMMGHLKEISDHEMDIILTLMLLMANLSITKNNAKTCKND